MFRGLRVSKKNLVRLNRAFSDKKKCPRKDSTNIKLFVIEERVPSTQEDYFQQQTPRQLEKVLSDFKLEQNLKLKEKEEEIKKIEERLYKKLKSKFVNTCEKTDEK